ncbi:cysteine--tRNA ligase [Deferribacterales bacterium Es71-Z0220]|uniref:cysteine--tRNA ligase n=1 Tax=Deferrivibrio essentukiensis TaxID=2880922 RepID=UPI001F60E301|nr:cysteine--tRNA ligase [Deferrivibrio essentukiensis]MCB4205008.1 cysteine--tRNA ligase [Deferrivibrio essentukiensis]
MEIFNTMTLKKETFEPIHANEVKMYVCGVTVYDDCHIGHARSSVVFDVIRKYLKYKGFKVTFVKNFTDIDDKIIKRSNELGISWKELTDRYIKSHDDDMAALMVERPDYTPKATEFINEMINLCERLIEKGYAYEKDGDVYFRVRAFKDYGKLSHRSIDDLLSGARVDINEIKEDPLDFALWKRSKENEPGWKSPWGVGRPGWHIECSAMSSKILGIPFDIHGGGKDLVFPHHENEIAQSEASEDKTFAKYWMHNGFVNINKEKMSKSLGNFFTIKDILKEFDREALRYFLLTTHYRSPLDFSQDNLIEAERALDRIYTALDEVKSYKPTKKSKDLTSEIEKAGNEFFEGFAKSMDDDFNTPAALSHLFEFVKALNIILTNKPDEQSYSLLLKIVDKVKSTCLDVLGIIQKEPEEWFKANLALDEEELNKLIEERNLARKNKNFAKADEIRDYLKEKGVELLDTLEGTKFRAKKIR